MLGELTDEAIDTIAGFAEPRPTKITDIVIWHQGGAMARVGESDTAYSGRDAGFLVTPEASWTDPAQTDEAIAWGRAAWDALGPYSTGGVYLNFPGVEEEQTRWCAPATAGTTSGSPSSRRSTTRTTSSG